MKKTLRNPMLFERSDTTASQNGPLETNAGQRPTFAARFRCIGSDCEDTCCGDWDIPLDKITYLKYRQFPAEELRTLVSHFVIKREGMPHDSWYGSILRKQDGACPFFGADRLCAIQKQYGPELLSSTCSIYPRSLAVVDGVLEGSLSLSCPEAARQVLLEDDSTEQTGDLFSGQFRTDNVFGVRETKGLGAIYLQVRGLIVELIRDRTRPVWQRLLLIVDLCIRLDSLIDQDLIVASDIVTRFRNSLGQRSGSEFDRTSPDIACRLELAIFLSTQRCQDPDCGTRFKDVFWDFIEAIGSTTSSGADEDVYRFRNANQDHLEPLLSEAPFMLENYLLNYIYQHLFPFGRSGSNRFFPHTMSEEAILLVVRYSWMTTLLAGVAGLHGSSFGKSRLVSTVQSFTRAVEHTPYILEEALVFVRSRGLDTLSGLTKLLRS
ncbi:flagellin lysine-N-methylase [Terriglobus sp. ADX1]|uniref:flagellin lysine-N-methylase n=1 Tax=Terriglobus sp. ADX1 TaxID=2794063 RepID=UPI002FE65A6E